MSTVDHVDHNVILTNPTLQHRPYLKSRKEVRPAFVNRRLSEKGNVRKVGSEGIETVVRTSAAVYVTFARYLSLMLRNIPKTFSPAQTLNKLFKSCLFAAMKQWKAFTQDAIEAQVTQDPLRPPHPLLYYPRESIPSDASTDICDAIPRSSTFSSFFLILSSPDLLLVLILPLLPFSASFSS